MSVRGGQLGLSVRYHSGARRFQVEALIPQDWRTSFDERGLIPQGGVVAARSSMARLVRR